LVHGHYRGGSMRNRLCQKKLPSLKNHFCCSACIVSGSDDSAGLSFPLFYSPNWLPPTPLVHHFRSFLISIGYHIDSSSSYHWLCPSRYHPLTTRRCPLRPFDDTESNLARALSLVATHTGAKQRFRVKRSIWNQRYI